MRFLRNTANKRRVRSSSRELEKIPPFPPELTCWSSMPSDCMRNGNINKERLTKNRNKYVRAQTIKLENECRVVQRILWRSDGLALDWALNREKGTYREFWPVDDCDRSEFAKRVAHRCRTMGGGRQVLSINKAQDAVEVAWLAVNQDDPPPMPKTTTFPQDLPPAAEVTRSVSTSVIIPMFPWSDLL